MVEVVVLQEEMLLPEPMVLLLTVELRQPEEEMAVMESTPALTMEMELPVLYLAEVVEVQKESVVQLPEMEVTEVTDR